MHKNLRPMYRALQNRPNLIFYTRGFDSIFLNILIYFLELNNDFKYLSHAGRVLTRLIEGGGGLSKKL